MVDDEATWRDQKWRSGRKILRKHTVEVNQRHTNDLTWYLKGPWSMDRPWKAWNWLEGHGRLPLLVGTRYRFCQNWFYERNLVGIDDIFLHKSCGSRTRPCWKHVIMTCRVCFCCYGRWKKVLIKEEQPRYSFPVKNLRLLHSIGFI